MQRRSEHRVSEQLPIRIWGMDSNGKPFAQNAKTLDVSEGGARLDLNLWNSPGEVVGVGFNESRARFRVVWVDRAAPGGGCVGLRCIEPNKRIWGETTKKALAAAVGASPVPPRAIVSAPLPKPAMTWTDGHRANRESRLGQNRRTHARYDCVGGVQVRQTSSSNVIWGRMLDLSLGGCYVEALSVLPKGTPIEVTVGVDGVQFRGRGEVTIVHPAFGFGVQFLAMDGPNRESLQQLIIKLAETKH